MQKWHKAADIEQEWGLPLAEAIVKALNLHVSEPRAAAALNLHINTLRYYRRKFGIERTQNVIWMRPTHAARDKQIITETQEMKRIVIEEEEEDG